MVNQDRDAPKPFLSLSTPVSQFLELLGRVLPFLSALTLGLSIFYDYSYLSALGLSFGEVQTNLADHLRSALVWVPSIGVGVALFALGELSTRVVEGFRSEAEIISASKNPERLRMIRQDPRLLYALSLGSFLVQQVFFSSSKSAYYFVFTFGWLIAALATIRNEEVRKKFSLGGAVLFALLPFAVGAIGIAGYKRGEQELASSTAVWTISIQKPSSEEQELVFASGLRRFSSSAIIVTTDGVIRVVSDSKILEAVKRRPAETTSVVCYVTGLACKYKTPF